jgi:hypothetical protein
MQLVSVFLISGATSESKVPVVPTIFKRYFVFAGKTWKNIEKIEVNYGLVLCSEFLLKTLISIRFSHNTFFIWAGLQWI